MTTITAYHGGQHDDPRWFTTDKSHAQSFGECRTYRLQLGSVLEIDMTHPALLDDDGYELMGYDADDALYGLLDDSGVDAIIVKGWEGAGLCILISPYVTVEEREDDTN